METNNYIKEEFNMRFFGKVWITEEAKSRGDLYLKFANFEEMKVRNPLFGRKSEEEIKQAKINIRGFYDMAAKAYGFKSMNELLKYQSKYKTDIVHGLWEEVLAE